MFKAFTIVILCLSIVNSGYAQKHEKIFGNNRNGRNWMQNSLIPANIPSKPSQSEISLDEVNRDYADRMWAVRNDQHLSPWKRDRILRRLNAELQQKILLLSNINPLRSAPGSSRIYSNY